MRDTDEDWYGRNFTDKRGRSRPHYLLCAECGVEVDDCRSLTCAECGATKAPREIRQERVSEVLHEEIYEGLYEEIQAEAQSWGNGSPVYVYAFVDPRNHATIYIGITRNPQARKSHHFNSDCPVGNWRRDQGVDPVMILLEQCATLEMAYYREAFLISMIPNLINRDVESKKNATLRKLVPRGMASASSREEGEAR